MLKEHVGDSVHAGWMPRESSGRKWSFSANTREQHDFIGVYEIQHRTSPNRSRLSALLLPYYLLCFYPWLRIKLHAQFQPFTER